MMPSRKLFFVFVLAFFSRSIGYGQNKDAIIKNIRTSFQAINGDTTLKIVKLENDEFMENATDGGGSLTGYFRNAILCKIHIWVGLSFGVRQFDGYLKYGQVFFIYETEQDFPANGGGQLDYTKPNPAFEGRYYFNEGKAIEKRSKGTGRFNYNGANIKDLLADIKRYSKILQARLKSKT